MEGINLGKLILCHGDLAVEPYHFVLTNTFIYSMEELSFYLYNNIYEIYEDTFTKELVKWLEVELNLPEIAKKLNHLIDNKNSLKDVVVTLLCACDYYEEDEIKDIIQIIDLIENLEPIRRQKIKADHYLKYKNYQLAQSEYAGILNAKDFNLFSEEEYGDILHNQAVIKLHTATIREAALKFKEAYEYNHDEETLKEYLYTLKLGNYDEEYQKEIQNYNLNSEILFDMNEEMNDIIQTMKESPSYGKLQQGVAFKEEGKLIEFYKEMDTLIYEWKREYRGN